MYGEGDPNTWYFSQELRHVITMVESQIQTVSIFCRVSKNRHWSDDYSNKNVAKMLYIQYLAFRRSNREIKTIKNINNSLLQKKKMNNKLISTHTSKCGSFNICLCVSLRRMLFLHIISRKRYYHRSCCYDCD